MSMYIPRNPSDPSSFQDAATAQGTGNLYANSIVWIIVALTIVGARLFTRIHIVKAPGIDDILIVVAVLASLGMSITMIAQIEHGMNTSHIQTYKVNQDFWASVWTYNLSLTTTKVSILVSYFRIFFQKPLRLLCKIILVFCTLFGSWTIIGSIFVCFPVSKAWESMELFGSEFCQNRYTAWFTNAAINMVIDLVLICLPMPVLKALNMPTKQKVALMFVFALGSFVCVMSAIRLYFLVSMSTTNDNKNTAAWSVIETNIGIICASLPSLKALVTWMWPRFGGPSLRSKDRSGSRPHGSVLPGAQPEHDAAFARSLGIKAYNTHVTRVQGGYDETTVWDKEDRFIVMQTDVQLSTMSSGLSASRPMSPQGQSGGLAVSCILERDIETMSDDGEVSRSTSIGDHSSQKDLFRGDSAHQSEKDDHSMKSKV